MNLELSALQIQKSVSNMPKTKRLPDLDPNCHLKTQSADDKKSRSKELMN